VIGSAQVPNSVFADFWSKVAATDTYKANPRVIFGLVNEPHDLPVTQWVDAANAAIVGIRATGATNLITVPNINYTGAWTWTDNGNGDAMLGIVDSGDNFFTKHTNTSILMEAGDIQRVSAQRSAKIVLLILLIGCAIRKRRVFLESLLRQTIRHVKLQSTRCFSTWRITPMLS
jgi:hypothetical protein